MNTASLDEALPDSSEIEQLERNNTYTVQILALKEQPKVAKWYFRGLNQKMISTLHGKDDYLRYVIGQFNNIDDAKMYLAEIQKDGRFADAWIRAWEPLVETSDSNILLSSN
jgi:hypothetical protein